MHRKILQTIQQHQMLSPGEQVVAGLSGGADSVALLYFLWSIRREWNIKLLACHVNHCLRGEESQRDESFCRQLCAGLEIPLAVYTVNAGEQAKAAGLSVEEYSRNYRYATFQQLCPKGGKIATAHTLSDKAETLLFHIARGTGVKGLEGIPPVRGNIIRPLIHCTREEIEGYCCRNGLKYVTDSSNLTDLYTRNKIRRQIIPLFRELNPAFYQSVERLARQAHWENDFMEQEAARQAQLLALGENQWDREAFLRLHPAMQNRVAAQWLKQWGAPVSAKKIGEMVQAAQESVTVEVVKGKYFTALNTLELREKQEVQPYLQIPFALGEFQLYPGRKVTILLREYKIIENNCQNILKSALDYDKINHTALLRQRKSGDKIEFAHTGCTRPVKKIFNEAKLTLNERSRRVILADEAGPLWVEGFGPARRAAVGKNTKQIVTIEVGESNEVQHER